MCIETQSLGTALLPKFASDVGYDVELLQLISAYQKNPGTETYQAVQKFLLKQKNEKQKIQNTFNNTKFNKINMHILDYEDNLLWSTSTLVNQDKIVLLYQASEYSSQATQGSSYKKFEDSSEFSLSWVSGSPIFFKGGALKTGTTSETETCDNTCSDGFVCCSGECFSEEEGTCCNGIYCGTGNICCGGFCLSDVGTCCNGLQCGTGLVCCYGKECLNECT
jgi:hypothetical protein